MVLDSVLLPSALFAHEYELNSFVVEKEGRSYEVFSVVPLSPFFNEQSRWLKRTVAYPDRIPPLLSLVGGSQTEGYWQMRLGENWVRPLPPPDPDFDMGPHVREKAEAVLEASLRFGREILPQRGMRVSDSKTLHDGRTSVVVVAADGDLNKIEASIAFYHRTIEHPLLPFELEMNSAGDSFAYTDDTAAWIRFFYSHSSLKTDKVLSSFLPTYAPFFYYTVRYGATVEIGWFAKDRAAELYWWPQILIAAEMSGASYKASPLVPGKVNPYEEIKVPTSALLVPKPVDLGSLGRNFMGDKSGTATMGGDLTRKELSVLPQKRRGALFDANTGYPLEPDLWSHPDHWDRLFPFLEKGELRHHYASKYVIRARPNLGEDRNARSRGYSRVGFNRIHSFGAGVDLLEMNRPQFFDLIEKIMSWPRSKWIRQHWLMPRAVPEDCGQALVRGEGAS